MSTIATLVIASMAAGLPTGPVEPAPVITRPAWVSSARHWATDRAKVSVWMDQQSPYHRGDNAQVYIKADRDAYVTVLRIDTDGRIRILFPIDPGDDNFARGGQAFEVLGRASHGAFDIDDAPGQGFVFAISSTDPFTYDGFMTGGHWDYRTIADGRVREDPYVVVTDLAAQIAPEGSWDYDMVNYDVEQHYDYPRFVCYDCHAYTSYYSWNPYDHFCSQYRIVIYDDPYYYPYRYYGSGVVYGRPRRPGPRYVFKDYDGSSGYVSRLPFRPRSPDGRTIPDRGRTSADLGGRGSVAIPVDGGGRRVDPLSGGHNDRPSGRDGHDRPGHGGGSGRPSDPGRRDGNDQPGVEHGGSGNGNNEHRPVRRGEPDRPSQTGNQSEPARRGDPDRPSQSGNQSEPARRGDPDRPSQTGNQSEPGRRGDRDRSSLSGNQSQPERRPAVEPRRPENHDRPQSRSDDRPPPAVQPRSSPPPSSAQPKSSPPPSRPTGAPELRRRKP